MYNDIEKILLSKEQIAKRVCELGKLLEDDYQGKMPVVAGILKGGLMFYTDLIREMNIPLECDFIVASSYGSSTTSSGNLKISKDLSIDIKGRHVIIVEDIIDSGFTLFNLKAKLLERQPQSLKICTLLNKPSRREVDITPDYNGFEIDDYFVVGYGLDYNEKYRNLKDIGILKPCIYTK